MSEVRLIDANALMKRVCEKECGPHFNIDLCDLDDDSTDTRCVFREYVRSEPTVEAEPVRHGRWIFVGEETMHDGWTYRKHKCSECGFSTVEAINFCPKCGARMDAEDINVFTKDGMTNGDKIRVMDDEELVEFLMNADANICDFCDMKYPENCLSHSCEGEDCKTEILKWLKQEVSEDAGSKTD